MYSISLSCNEVYIGETGRCLKTRITEYKYELRNINVARSGEADHCIPCGCISKFEDSNTVATRANIYKRRIRENTDIALKVEANIEEKGLEISRL